MVEMLFFVATYSCIYIYIIYIQAGFLCKEIGAGTK